MGFETAERWSEGGRVGGRRGNSQFRLVCVDGGCVSFVMRL
jgi:hypothetical protein